MIELLELAIVILATWMAVAFLVTIAVGRACRTAALMDEQLTDDEADLGSIALSFASPRSQVYISNDHLLMLDPMHRRVARITPSGVTELAWDARLDQPRMIGTDV